MSFRSTVAGVAGVITLVAGTVLIGALPASATTDLGGVNIAQYYCDPVYGQISQTVNINNQWDGWRCARGASLYGVNMNQACNNQYGGGAWANHTSSSMYSWRCYR